MAQKCLRKCFHHTPEVVLSDSLHPFLLGDNMSWIKIGGATMSYNQGGFGGRSNRGYGGRGFGGGRRFDDNKPKPVETGKEYDVSVTEISRKGDGIARVEGFVIFVKNGKVGQNTKVKITEVGQRFATAEIVEGSQPAAE